MWYMRGSSSVSSNTVKERWPALTSPPPARAQLWTVRTPAICMSVPEFLQVGLPLGSTSLHDSYFSIDDTHVFLLNYILQMMANILGDSSLSFCFLWLPRQHCDRRDNTLFSCCVHFRIRDWDHSQQLCGLMGLGFRHRVRIPCGIRAEWRGRWTTVPRYAKWVVVTGFSDCCWTCIGDGIQAGGLWALELVVSSDWTNYPPVWGRKVTDPFYSWAEFSPSRAHIFLVPAMSCICVCAGTGP